MPPPPPKGPPSAPSDAPTQALDSSAARRAPGLYLQDGSDFGARFRIVRCLGEGAMGTVYQAHDRELDRTVALKVLPPDRTADASALLRFKRELLMARAVSHVNILRIHDLGDVDGIKFISMDCVDGEDLHALLRREAPLAVPRAVAFARQLCAALQAAHDAGVLHRDLKPRNVLVGAGDHLYVGDFGLAKSLTATDPGLTDSGATPGTPRYMSPEQVGGRPLDSRSDVYALGLILYEMLTGTVPFAGGAPLDEMLQRVKSAPRDPGTLTPGLPAHLRRIVLRCLERDPDARYQTASEVLADLEGQRAPRRHRRWGRMLARVAVVAAVAGGLALTLAQPKVRGALVRTWRAWWPAPPAERQRVAVLPFRVLGDDPALARLGPGLAESLSSKLSSLGALNVASATAVERAARKPTMDQAARDLGASRIVTGTVQQGGGRIRVVTELEDVASHRRLWSRESEFLPADLLTAEDQIYAGLLGALGLAPTTEERARAAATGSENVEAYELYLAGRNLMRGDQDTKNVLAAIASYEEALARDSRFALAYAGLATAQLRMYRATKDAAWAGKAVAAAEQARSIAEDLLEVRLALANVYQATGKNAEAIAELTRATALFPSSDEAFRRLGRAYLTANRKTEAIATLQKAVAVNPYHWVNYAQLGFGHYTLGQYGQAADAYRKEIALEPDNAVAYNDLGAASLCLGHFPDAVAAFEKAIALQPNANTYTNLGLASAYAGKYPEAVPMFEKAALLEPQAPLYAGNLGDGYRWTGAADKAREMYERAIALGFGQLDVNPRDAQAKTLLALNHAKIGDHVRARRFLNDALQLGPADVTITYTEAIVDGLAGRIPEGLAALAKAMAAGLALPLVEADPNLAPLRADPRYSDVRRAFASPSP